MFTRTVVAQATCEGESGLAVVRLSGPQALAIAARVFSGPDLSAPGANHRAVYGILHAPLAAQGNEIKQHTPEALDQVLALPMHAPHSYTGEDTVEFFCHGGLAVPRAAVRACRLAGAEPAAAGEFTRRAFLNGKLSLDQAEAVADLIHAQSDLAARGAVRQLMGGLDEQLRRIEEPLLDLLAALEGWLEFTEEDQIDLTPEAADRILREAVAGIDALLAIAPAGRILREGVQVVLLGAANAGKSSLFNALLGRDRAIVDHEAGTTRDVVSDAVDRGGNTYVLHDTAGLRAEPGRVEELGIERTRRTAARADIILLLIPADGAGAPSCAGAGCDPPTEFLPAGVPVIRVLTKLDLAAAGEPADREATRPPAAPEPAAGGRPPIGVSSLTGAGLPELWEALEAAVRAYGPQEAAALGVVLNERHRDRLQQCRRGLAALVLDRAAGQSTEEVTATLLAGILAELGEVSGRVFSEKLLEAVFGRFCVGK